MHIEDKKPSKNKRWVIVIGLKKKKKIAWLIVS
jgi:hypothetical protein